MPVISKFYGITIRMYFQQSEHNPPHIHAIYGDWEAAIGIRSKDILAANAFESSQSDQGVDRTV